MDHNEIAAVSPNPNLTDRSVASPQYEMAPRYAAQWKSAEAEEEGFISPRTLYRALSHWWYIALPVACVFATVSSAIVVLSFTPVYRSTAVLKIASYTPYIAYTINEQPMKPEEFTQTQIELMQNRLVMEQVLTRPEVAQIAELQEQENPTTWLANKVRVDQVGSSELYNVYLDAKDPDSSALLVNAILEEYFAVRQRDEESQTSRVIELLKQEKDRRSDKIQVLRDTMRETAKTFMGGEAIPGLEDEGKAKLLGDIKEMGQKLTDAEIERQMLEIEIKAVSESMQEQDLQIADVELEVAISETQEIRDLRILIANKTAMLHTIETAAAAGREDRSYLRVQREIAVLERSLELAASEARPLIADQLETMARLDNQDLLNQLQAKLQLQLTREKIVRARYEDERAKAAKSGDKLFELEFNRAELAREEKVFDMIAERSMALQTESRAPGRVALLRPAEIPVAPVESLPLRNLAAAIFASGFLPFGLAVLWELSVKRISDVDQLSQHSALSVVGEVAKLPMRLRSIGPGGSRAMSLFEESIDSLRVGLILPDQNHDVKIIAVTSAVHSEGKSSISSQLAVSIGRSVGDSVLLIDGDLRAPDAHHIFEISNDLGLAAVLDGRATLDEAIITSWSDNLHLLPAGRLRKSPHRLMTVELLKDLFDQLRPRYRYIVIDTPPILSASEALMLAKLADGTVLSTRRNVSREHQVRLAYERLMKAGARPMGAVFNGVPTRSYAQTYGSYDYTRSFD